MQKIIVFIFISLMTLGCGTQSSSSASTLSMNDLNYCAFIENNNNLFVYNNTGDWTQFFKSYYLKKNFAPDHSALQYIDSEIKNINYDMSNPDTTFEIFMISLPSWQERCRQIKIDPNY